MEDTKLYRSDMFLIADSGATKTDWSLVSREKGEQMRFSSQGYNPNYMTGEEIVTDILANLPEGFPSSNVNAIYFYGAGVSELLYDKMRQVLGAAFPSAHEIFVAMDTLAACRALLGYVSGFAAILGTGMNTVLYDGKEIMLNIESGGFMLGDEGSGAYLGKRLIIDYLRHNMPEDAYASTAEAIGLSDDEIIDRIYSGSFPNRFCAAFSKFIGLHINESYFRTLVEDSFRQLFDNVVSKYPEYRKYEFNAVGSVAYHYREVLEDVASEYGMKTGLILKAPMDGLVKYHIRRL